jgi:hypothetical protein
MRFNTYVCGIQRGIMKFAVVNYVGFLGFVLDL